MHTESQDIETATTATTSAAPDAKTRRYDRQLRLWAATGQSALESARILVIGASATSTSILKNLVLPGIGHFTILDHAAVSPADAGNNFFLAGPASIGKNRAEEAVRLLRELNDSVDGVADTRDIRSVLADAQGRSWIAGFTLVIAHNLPNDLLTSLAGMLWKDRDAPALMAVRSAGFLAEFSIQFHEHQIIESHSDTTPSLRLDKPFPALREHALGLDFAGMDPTDHGHVPYVVILVRALEDWKQAHGDEPPKTYEAKQAFKKAVLAMRVKVDEENFEEAEQQAYRAWTATTVPSDVAALLADPALAKVTAASPPFERLLAALAQFVREAPHGTLPLSAALPDMRSDTTRYIALQTMYKREADAEKAHLRSLVKGEVDDAMLDTFVKNAHALRVLQGRALGAFDADKEAIAAAAASSSKQVATHFALAAQAKLGAATPTAEALSAEARALLGSADIPEEDLDAAIGEIARAATAELPNMAAFLGGLVAQEAIKMVTKQYVPINGYCVVDLVETWTGVIG